MMVNVCLNSKHSDCNALVIMSNVGESDTTKGNFLSFAMLSQNVKILRVTTRRIKKENKTA